MPILNVKNPEAHRLASELAAITGSSLTQTVVHALREQLRRESGRGEARDLSAELMEIGRRCAALPVFDDRTPDEILGYDEHGIPS